MRLRGHSKSRNEEMRLNGKRGNEEMEKGTSRFTQQTADILLLQSLNVMRKSMSIQHLLRDHLYFTVCTKGVYVCEGIASWLAS